MAKLDRDTPPVLAIALELLGHIIDIVMRKLRPPIGRDLTVLGVQADQDVAGKLDTHVGDKVWRRHRFAAENDILDTSVQVSLDGVLVPDTTADFDRNIR